MSFKSNPQSGFPSGYDYYSEGSELTAKNIIKTPEGMNTVAPSAVVNEHHDERETKPIGVPGSTYTPHREDIIHRSSGGHAIIYGNSPGNETLRIQGSAGQVIELSHDGSMRISTGAGLHMSINGDNQIVLQGDLAITTTGAFRFKAGAVYWDVGDWHLNIKGHSREVIHGDHNSQIYGDSHSTTTGDTSSIVGGDHRTTVAGDSKQQVAGDLKSHAAGNTEHVTKGTATIGSKGKMNVRSEGDMSMGSKGNFVAQAGGAAGFLANGTATFASAGGATFAFKNDLTFTTEGKFTATAKGALSIGTEGQMDITSKGNAVVKSDAEAQFVGKTNNKFYTQGALTFTADSEIRTPHPVTNTSKLAHTDATTSVSLPEAKSDIPEVKPIVPERKEIIDAISDYVATDGEVNKILHAGQIRDMYSVDEGGEIPEKVKSRAQELGINLKPSVDNEIASSEAAESSGSTVADVNNGDYFNPIG